MANEYVTLAEYKAYMGVDDALGDGWWPTAIESASRGLDEYCGRVFYAATISSRDYVIDDPCCARVDDFYTSAGLVLKTDTGGDGGFATTWTVNTHFQLEPLNGITSGVTGHPYTRLRAVGGLYFPSGYRGRANVRVTASWGWLAVPPVVKTATLELAKDLGKSKDFAAGAMGFGDVYARIKDNPALISRLAPYRHPSLLMVG